MGTFYLDVFKMSDWLNTVYFYINNPPRITEIRAIDHNEVFASYGDEPCPLCGDDINIGDMIVACTINNHGHYWDCRGKCPNPDNTLTTFELEEGFTYQRVVCLHYNEVYWCHKDCCA